jgi:hypothetical protein
VLFGPQQWEEGLGYGEQAEHVDLEVLAHLVQGLVHERAGEGGSGIVYEARQTGAA